MSDFKRCKKCGEYGWVNTHQCPPKWYVRHDWHDDGDETEIFATTPQEAAEKYAERSDAYGDYDIVNGSPAIVVVIEPLINQQHWFEVEGHPVPEYSAEPIKDSAPNQQ